MINIWFENYYRNNYFCNLIPLDVIGKLKNDTILKENKLLHRYLSQMSWLAREGVELHMCNKENIEQQLVGNNFFPIELYWARQHPESDFNIDLDFIKETNSKLFLWWPKEAFTNSINLRKAMDTCDNFNEIIFVTGNLKKIRTDPDFPNVTFKRFDYWWFFLKNFMEDKRPILNINKIENYEYTFFNRRCNLVRSVLYYRMLNQGKLQNAKHSYYAIYKDGKYYPKGELLEYLYCEIAKDTASNHPLSIEYKEILNDNAWPDWIFDRFKNSLPEYFPTVPDTYLVDNLHNESYLDVITETLVDNDTLFITEKTYRSIANGSIFLIMGCPGTLKYLKSKGIETFSDLFDESYDDENILHWFDRWKIIEKNLDIWHSLGKEGRQNYYKKSFDKLVHNQNLLYNRSFKTEIEELFEN